MNIFNFSLKLMKPPQLSFYFIQTLDLNGKYIYRMVSRQHVIIILWCLFISLCNHTNYLVTCRYFFFTKIKYFRLILILNTRNNTFIISMRLYKPSRYLHNILYTII